MGDEKFKKSDEPIDPPVLHDLGVKLDPLTDEQIAELAARFHRPQVVLRQPEKDQPALETTQGPKGLDAHRRRGGRHP